MIKSLYRSFNEGGLLKHSSILFAGTMGVHVLNVLFQMFMGRYLRPEEYALLAALLGVFNILATPLGVIVSTFNRYSSLLVQENRAGDVLRLGLRWGIRLAILGAIPSLLCFIMPLQIARFFHLERIAPVYIFGFILTGIFCSPVVNGMLLGMQRFNVWCLGNIIGAAVRLGIGIGLVLMISPFAGWGLLGHGIGFYSTILVGSAFIFSGMHSRPTTQEPLPRIEGFLFGSFFVLFGYSMLMTADVILVKNLYPESAADFAYAATLARLVLLVPTAFIGAMFPKVVAQGTGTREQLIVLNKTLLMALLSTVATALMISILAGFLPRFIYGLDEVSADMVRWIRMLSFIMIPVALFNVLTRFLLAQHKLLKAICVPFAAVAYIGSSYALTTSVDGILYCLLIVSLVALMWVGAIIIMDSRHLGERT
jgi:O-antigen/teichoic acid export membrane protein